MVIPTILKGDDSGPISITMAEGHVYADAALVIAYQGATRTFTDLEPGKVVSFSFTHEETETFEIGTKPFLMRLIGPTGAIETVENAETRIKTTDCMGEVNAGSSFIVTPGEGFVPVTDVGDISSTAKIKELYDKVNEIVRVLAQRSLLALSILALCLSSIGGGMKEQLGELTPQDLVVTNVDGYIEIPSTNVPPGYIVVSSTNGVEWVQNKGVDTNVVIGLVSEYDATNIAPRIDERILMPSNTVPVGRLLAKATNGVEWIFFQGGGGSLGSITMVKDTTNGWHKVRAELNPVGQIVLSIDQDVSTNKLLTIEEERDRAMGAELQNTYLITTETVRSMTEDEDLSERIDAISSVGRFLSTWDCTTGRPGTEPKVSPMPYKAGDYYLVASVSETITNYVPVGTVYTNGSASTAFTTNSVAPNDLFRHTEDGSWVHVSMSGVITTFALINGEPRDNAKLAHELDDAATNLLDMVIAETNRATAAENLIRTSLSNETARAYCAETNLLELVEAETNRAYVAETNIMQVASNETVRAYTAETNLQCMVEAETNRAYVVETNIIALVEAETNRAYVAETNIAASVSNETLRAYCAETNIQHQVNVETNRAYVAETNLQHMFEAETNRAYVAETNLLAIVEAETNRAWISETNLAHQIASEHDRATNAERVVSVSATNYTDAVGMALHVAITNVEHQVVAETNRAHTAERAIADDLTAEIVRAYTAETNIAASVSNEYARAYVAETNLANSVVIERDRAYAAETNIAASATNYTDVATNALGAAVIGMISGLDDRIVTETNRAQTAESGLDVRVVAETNRAQTAEAAISTAVTNETIRAYTVETNQMACIFAVSNIAESAVKVEVDPSATAKANAAIVDAGCVTTNESGDIINTINNIYATGVLYSQQEVGLIHDGSLYAFTYNGFSSGTVGSLDNWKMPWAEDYESDPAHSIALRSHVTNEEHRASVAETNLHERIVAETNRSITADAQLAAHKRDVRDLVLIPYLDDLLFPITDTVSGAAVTEHFVVKNTDNTYTLKDEGGANIANFGTDGKLTGDSLKWLFNGLHLSSYAAKILVHGGDRLARLSDVPSGGVTFDSALQKTNALNQIETSRIDIIALGDKEAEQDEEISKLRRKSYWVGSIATIPSGSDVDAVLNAYVTNTMHRAAAEGDQVTVTDIHTVYQRSADTHWKVFTDAGAVEHASVTQYGVVKVGSGIDVTNGVISVTKDNSIRVFATLDFEAWVDSSANVPVESSVLVYADTTTGGGIAAAALYRIYKKDASTVVVDAYAIGNGKLYRKIKALGIWGTFAEIGGGGGGGGGSAEWGSIGGNLADQIDLYSVLVSKLNTSEVVQNLNDTNPQHAASIVALAGERTRAIAAETNLDTNKQDRLPTLVRDKYLHVKAGSDELEWADAGGGGGGGSYIEDSDGNRIAANRTVTQSLSTFSDANITLLQTVYSTNRWEGTVGEVVKAVEWNGVSWTCEGFEAGSTIYGLDPSDVGASRLVIVQPTEGQVTLDRGSSVKGYGKVVTSEEVTRQIVFDICHPVNSIWIQYTADDNPNTLFNGNGVVSVWTDMTADFTGRYFAANSTRAAATRLTETLPNIKGAADFDVYSDEERPAVNLRSYEGCFKQSGTTYSKIHLKSPSTSTYEYQKKLGFDASGSSSVYKNNAAVRPLTSTVKVWKRTN